MAKKPLILVDGSSYLFRAYHAIPPLNNRDGEPTAAIYGVINMLKSLLLDYQPERMAVIFDTKEKTFREDIYSDYKANREAMPDDLAQQIKPLHSLIQALGLPMIFKAGFEADDIIGTLAKQATAKREDVVIISGDKDLAQLVNKHVILVDTMRGTRRDIDGVIERFGVKPEQIADLLALTGDSIDNIPGIPKVGPKTATKWLNQYGNLQGVIDHAEEITGKVGESLRENLDVLSISKQLTEIHCDMDLNDAYDNLALQQPDMEQCRYWYERLEFRRWLNEITDSTPKVTTNSQAITVLDQKTFDQWLKKIQQADYFGFDTETTSLNALHAELVGISLAVADKSCYIPLAHDAPNSPKQLDRTHVLKQLKPILEDPKQFKVGHHLKYDLNVLRKYDIELAGIAFDTMLESYIFNSIISRHDLDSLCAHYLNHDNISYEQVAGKGAKQIPFNQVAVDVASAYAAEDAQMTLALHEHLWPQLQEQPALAKVFSAIEMPLVPILAQMEATGVCVDDQVLAKQSKSLTKKLNQLMDQIYDEAGEAFNIDSPKQLQQILYEKLDLPILAKTPKGQPSTAESVLTDLSVEYLLPELILNYRSLAKLKNTYVDKLPLCIDEKTKRVHTSFHQAVTATGRLSSSDPNLQNIPIKTEAGRAIRQAFIAPKGYQLIAADYSQIELRIMAHLSKDKGLCQAFAEDKDIHRATAAEIFGLSLDEVTAEQRRHAKAVNFGLIYGMSAFGLAKQLKIAREDAAEYIDIYFDRYPGVKEYMQLMKEQAAKQGYVETLLGRRLHLPNIKSKNPILKKQAERVAINAPMQGTAADLIKMAMINVEQQITEQNLDAKMILQVHDELIFEVPEAIVEQTINLCRNAMTQVFKLDVPLKVDIGAGNHWGQAHG